MIGRRLLQFVHLVLASELDAAGTRLAKAEADLAISATLLGSLRKELDDERDIRKRQDGILGQQHGIIELQESQILALRESNENLRKRITAADREIDRQHGLLEEANRDMNRLLDGAARHRETLERLERQIAEMETVEPINMESAEAVVLELVEMLGVRSADELVNAVELLTHGEGEAFTRQLALVRDEDEPDTDPPAEAELVYDREIPGVFEIAKISFVEGNKWYFQNGAARFSATIEDEEFLGRVDRRELAFAHGDIFKVRLAAKTWRIPGRGLKSEYRVVKIQGIAEPSEQMSFTDLPRVEEARP